MRAALRLGTGAPLLLVKERGTAGRPIQIGQGLPPPPLAQALSSPNSTPQTLLLT